MSRFGVVFYDKDGVASTNVPIPVVPFGGTADKKAWLLVWDLYRPLDGSEPTRKELFRGALSNLKPPFTLNTADKGLHILTFLAWDKGAPPTHQKTRHFFQRSYTVLVHA